VCVQSNLLFMATFLTGNLHRNRDNFISSYMAADHVIIAWPK